MVRHLTCTDIVRPLFLLAAVSIGIIAPSSSAAQGAPLNRRAPLPARPASADSVRPIAAPRTAFPSEDASAGVTRFSFIDYGDTRGRFDGQLEQQLHLMVITSMLRTIASRANGPDPIRFVVSGGDAVSDGRNAQQWNTSFVDVMDRLTKQGDVPVFPAPGNHDATHTGDREAPDRQQALRHFYAAYRNFIPPETSPRRLAGYPTYAFGYGNTFVLAMDSNIAEDSTQYAWICGQLSNLDRQRYKHVVVVLHHPAFSSGPHGGPTLEAPAAALRARYMPIFRQYHVDLILAGHEHLFEHWVERYRDASGPHRIDQIVSGGGGAPHYAYRGEPDLKEYLRSGVADSVRLEHLVRPGMNAWENPSHYLVIHVDGDRIRVEVIGVDDGADFQPYRSRSTDLEPSSRP